MISTGVCYEPTTISAGYRHLYFTTPMQLTECISREWCSRITHPSHVATGTGPNHAKMTIRGPHGRTLHTHTFMFHVHVLFLGGVGTSARCCETGDVLKLSRQVA